MITQEIVGTKAMLAKWEKSELELTAPEGSVTQTAPIPIETLTVGNIVDPKHVTYHARYIFRDARIRGFEIGTVERNDKDARDNLGFALARFFVFESLKLQSGGGELSRPVVKELGEYFTYTTPQ